MQDGVKWGFPPRGTNPRGEVCVGGNVLLYAPWVHWTRNLHVASQFCFSFSSVTFREYVRKWIACFPERMFEAWGRSGQCRSPGSREQKVLLTHAPLHQMVQSRARLIPAPVAVQRPLWLVMWANDISTSPVRSTALSPQRGIRGRGKVIQS